MRELFGNDAGSVADCFLVLVCFESFTSGFSTFFCSVSFVDLVEEGDDPDDSFREEVFLFVRFEELLLYLVPFILGDFSLTETGGLQRLGSRSWLEKTVLLTGRCLSLSSGLPATGEC